MMPLSPLGWVLLALSVIACIAVGTLVGSRVTSLSRGEAFYASVVGVAGGALFLLFLWLSFREVQDLAQKLGM